MNARPIFILMLSFVLGLALVLGGCDPTFDVGHTTTVNNYPPPAVQPAPSPAPISACDRCMDYCVAENGGSYCGTFCNEACRWYENDCVPQCDGAMCGGGDGCGGVCQPSAWHDADWYGCVSDLREHPGHPAHPEHPCDKGRHRGDKHCDDEHCDD
jgi:hypothetical protein